MSERTDKPEDIYGVSDYLFSQENLTQLFKNNDEISFGNKAWQGLANVENSPIVSDAVGDRLSTKKLSEFLRNIYTTTRGTPKVPGMGVKSWFSLNLIEDYFVGSNQELPVPKEPREDPEFDGQLVFSPGDLTNFAYELGVDMGSKNARRIEEVIANNLFKNNRILCDLLPKNDMFRLDGAYITTTNDRWMTILGGVEKITLAQLDQLFYDIETFNPYYSGSVPVRHHYTLVKYLRAIKESGVDLSQEQSFKPSHPCINPGFKPAPARKEDVAGDIITNKSVFCERGECRVAVEEGLFYPMTGLFYEVEEGEGGDKQYYLSKQRLTKFLGNVVPNYSYESTLIKENKMRWLIALDARHGEKQQLPYADTSYSEGILAFNPSDLLSFAEELEEEIADPRSLFDNLRQIAIDSLTSRYIAPHVPGPHEYDDMRYCVLSNGDIQIVDLSLDFISARLEGCTGKSSLNDAYIFCRYFKALRQQGARIKL